MNKIDALQSKIEEINNCNNAIAVITDLLIEFAIDTDCLNEIPEKINNRYVQGGLLAAVQIAAHHSMEATEWLQREAKNIAYAKQTEAQS